MCGALSLPAPQAVAVRGHPGLFTIVVSPDHVRGDRKALEILDVQPPITMSRCQLVESVSPHPTLEKFPGSLKAVSDSHRFRDLSRPRRVTQSARSSASRRTGHHALSLSRRRNGDAPEHPSRQIEVGRLGSTLPSVSAPGPNLRTIIDVSLSWLALLVGVYAAAVEPVRTHDDVQIAIGVEAILLAVIGLLWGGHRRNLGIALMVLGVATPAMAYARAPLYWYEVGFNTEAF